MSEANLSRAPKTFSILNSPTCEENLTEFIYLTACGKQVCLNDLLDSSIAAILSILNGFFSQVDAHRALVGDNLRPGTAAQIYEIIGLLKGFALVSD